MMATRLVKIVSAVVCVAHLAGCVRPGRIDPTVLNGYQRSVLMRSPRRRGGDGLGLIRPAKTIGPKVKIVTKDGKTRIELTHQEAVQRALANSPIIAAVGFDPAISREEMIAAAAAFDVVLFGSFDYRRVDDRPSNVFGGGQTDTRDFEGGVKQALTTGGSWSVAYSLSRMWTSSTFQSLAIQYEPRLVLEITQPLLRDAWPEFNLAQLRIARVGRQISESAFRSQVEAVVTDVISSYLTLRRERRALKIQEILLAMAVKTLEPVKARAEIDATAVQIKQTEAAVANRRLSVIEAKHQILKAQDALVRLLSDPQINLSAEVEIVPVTPLARAALNAARVELQALEDVERIRGRLTPEFLQLKLRAQEAVVAGELVEIDAIRFYNFSLVDLYTVTGTILKMQGVQIPGATMDLPAAVSAAAGESDWSKKPQRRNRR